MDILNGIIRGSKYAYRLINILSIDVAIGACVMSAFIAGIFGLSVPSVTLLTLFLSVWIIYSVDHLGDAKNIPHTSHTNRHRFHQQHYSVLKRAVLAGLLIQILLLFFLPHSIIWKGIVMIGIVLAYFFLLWLFRYKRIYHKELVIAIVYTSGVFLPTFNLLEFTFSFELLIVFLQVCSLAFCNLLTFALLETQSDQLDRQSSIALSIGVELTAKVLYGILFIGLLITLVFFVTAESRSLRIGQLILLVMFLLSAGILRISWFKKHERFRYWGDAVFIFPLLYILWL